jgi:hypothetical protein
LIHPDREDQLVVSVIPELFKHDIVIVPLSQIPPTLETNEKEAMKAESGKTEPANTEANKT